VSKSERETYPWKLTIIGNWSGAICAALGKERGNSVHSLESRWKKGSNLLELYREKASERTLYSGDGITTNGRLKVLVTKRGGKGRTGMVVRADRGALRKRADVKTPQGWRRLGLS